MINFIHEYLCISTICTWVRWWMHINDSNHQPQESEAPDASSARSATDEMDISIGRLENGDQPGSSGNMMKIYGAVLFICINMSVNAYEYIFKFKYISYLQRYLIFIVIIMIKYDIYIIQYMSNRVTKYFWMDGSIGLYWTGVDCIALDWIR